jgi:amino acid adenylation domain-containing protein
MSADRCIHDVIQEQARATPAAVALVAGGQQISYGELDARANQLAHLLRSSGVGPDIPVGLYMQRSIDLAIGALGILKAGGAYVPLDPSYPANRISMLLEDSGASLVVTQQCLAAKIPGGRWTSVVLDQEGLNSARYSRVPSQTNTKSNDLAYIIFTSGSTGRPKGVMVSHANLVNLISWHRGAFNITPADRATLYASPGFDASVWELWPYLAAGASVHVVDDAVRTTPESLRDWIVANKITVSFLPTALAECMLDLPWPSDSKFRVLLTGADTLRRCPPGNLPFALVNNYGPTECTVVATSGTVFPEDGAEVLPSIGRPIDNVTVHIVDEDMRPMPAGTSGELLIGGFGVARGYLNAPELTAEKFLPDPFSSDPQARLYRTGDLAHYLPDGQISFLGRIDEQIKIMGYRIEPREISALLDQHTGIKESLVASYLDPSGTRRLVAYVVPSSAARLMPGQLRDFLSRSLPDHMLPSAFVQLAEMPLSINGKLNRLALPRPSPENILDDDSFEAPQSAVEEHLASFLATLVGVQQVSREDNFFTLGGHSLMGAQLIAKVRAMFGVDLPLRSLFEEPTVRGMSAEIERLIYAKVSAMSEDEAQRMLSSSVNGI